MSLVKLRLQSWAFDLFIASRNLTQPDGSQSEAELKFQMAAPSATSVRTTLVRRENRETWEGVHSPHVP